MPLVLAAEAMGTRFEFVLPGLDERNEIAAGEAALAEVAEWESRLSLFRRDSLIAKVNREAAGGPVRVDPETFGLLERCRELLRDTQGAFDAGLGAQMTALGFRGEATPASAVELGGFADVELDPVTCSVRFGKATVQLDLGGIAKGFALDRAADILRAAGVTSALLHGGTSTVLGLGTPPTRVGWRVALGEGDLAPRVQLLDRALSVSAQAGRRNAQGAGHVLDPRGGALSTGPDSAAVVASDATTADAWSTALLVLGALPASATKAGIEAMLETGDGAHTGWRASGPNPSFSPPQG